MKLQAVKGTFDILPEDQDKWRFVLEHTQKVLARAGVKEITPPIFEYSEVFTKSAGSSSDLVVQHEMYSFTRGEKTLTLRPEFTAGVLRAFIENGMYTRPAPVKLYSKGPAFRAENTQRGRFRQFHQVNCEFLGLETPLIDAEAIALLYNALRACGLKNIIVKLGSVGDLEDRARYNEYLRSELEANKNKLSAISQERLHLNPMRILDSKDKSDQEIIKNLQRPLDFLNEQAKVHFEIVKSYLSTWEIPFELDNSIVRGLDYYCRTAFEIHHTGIGAQSALGGGGRYDGLVENLGGPKTPGVGWAFGIERVLDALKEESYKSTEADFPLLFLIPLDEQALTEITKLAQQLRQNFHIEYAYVKRSPSKGLKEANRVGATLAALRGNDERQKNIYKLKHLQSGQQYEVLEKDLVSFLKTTSNRIK